jgi:hypothetical protein
MRKVQLKAARGAGERFIFAVFWWRKDGVATGRGNFINNGHLV